MLEINFIGNNNKPVNWDLNKIEKLFGIILPNDYKDFLLYYNGGIFGFSRPTINMPGSNVKVIPEIIYGLETDKYDLMKDNFSIRKGRYPNGFISIGGDPGGNSFLLCCNEGLDYGKVYFWDHENENPYEGEAPWMENMYLVANSFTEFMENIKADEN